MLTVRYLYANIYTTAIAAASVQVARTSKLVAVHFAISGQGGAAIDSFGTVSISKSNASGIGTNDYQNTIAHCCWSAASVNSAAIQVNSFVAVGGVEFRTGDYVYLHCLRNQTQPTSLSANVTLYFQD